MNNQPQLAGQNQHLLNGSSGRSPKSVHPLNYDELQPLSVYPLLLIKGIRLVLLFLMGFIGYQIVFLDQNFKEYGFIIINDLWVLVAAYIAFDITVKIWESNLLLRYWYEQRRKAGLEGDTKKNLYHVRSLSVRYALYPYLMAGVASLLTLLLAIAIRLINPISLIRQVEQNEMNSILFLTFSASIMWYSFRRLAKHPEFIKLENEQKEYLLAYNSNKEAVFTFDPTLSMPRTLRRHFLFLIISMGICWLKLDLIFKEKYRLIAFYLGSVIVLYAARLILDYLQRDLISAAAFDERFRYRQWFTGSSRHPRQKYLLVSLLLLYIAAVAVFLSFFDKIARMSSGWFIVAVIFHCFLFAGYLYNTSAPSNEPTILDFLVRGIAAIIQPWRYVNALDLRFFSKFPEFHAKSKDYNAEDDYTDAKSAELLPLAKGLQFYINNKKNLVEAAKTPSERFELRQDISTLIPLFTSAVRQWDLPTNNAAKKINTEKVRLYNEAANYLGLQQSLLEQGERTQFLEPDAFRLHSIHGGEARIIRDEDDYITEFEILLPCGSYSVAGEIEGTIFPEFDFEVDVPEWRSINFKERGQKIRTGTITIYDRQTGISEVITFTIKPY